MNLEEKIVNFQLSKQLKRQLIKNKIYNLNDLLGFLSVVDLSQKGISTRYGLKKTLIEELLYFKNNVIPQELFNNPITLDSSLHFSPRYIGLTREKSEISDSLTYRMLVDINRCGSDAFFTRLLSIIPDSVVMESDVTVETSILDSDLAWKDKSLLLMNGYVNFYQILNLDEIDIAKSNYNIKPIIIAIRKKFKHENVLYLTKPVTDLQILGIETSNLGGFSTLQDLLSMPKNVYIDSKQKSAIEQLFHAAGYRFAYEIEKDLFSSEEMSVEEIINSQKLLSADISAVRIRLLQKQQLINRYNSLLEEYHKLVSKEAELDSTFEELSSEVEIIRSKK